MKIIKRISLFLINLILIFGLIGCDRPTTLPLTDEDYNQPITLTTFIYSDTCIITNHSQASKEITFQNIETGLRYTLSYDNITCFYDKYGKSLVYEQITSGDICDISFDRENKMLKTLNVSSDYFVISNVDSFNFYNSATRLEYLGDKYDLDDNLVVCSPKEEINVLEIADGDIITLHGYDHTIYSITQDEGHGYVSLANDDYFIDGFIEIEKDIRKITKDMIITVPEGNHNILISKSGTSAVKEVTVGRNQELEIDLSDIEIKELYGNITFSVNPSDAVIYIDGKKLDNIDIPVRLECGVHEMLVRADGYETISRYISVGTMDSELSIKLDKLQDDEDDSSSSETGSVESSSSETGSAESSSSDNSTSDSNTSTDNSASSDNSDKTSTKVYIDAPEGAELYLDGNYVGIVPASFAKTTGNIVITLRKNGYQTRSYSINLEDLTTDSHYSFSELLKLSD